MINLGIGSSLIKNIELVIFDRDGTLIDLYAYWSWMIGKRAQIICRDLDLDAAHLKKLMFAMGIDEDNKRIRPDGPVGLKKREIVMQAAVGYLLSIGYPETSGICFKAFCETDRLSSDNLAGIIKPINGVHELFLKLTDNKCRIAIATTDKTERARIAMDFLGLAKSIDFIVGEDSVKNCKPAPDMVNLILDSLGVDRSNAAMVGDALTDIEMGIRSGLKASIGVCSGITPGNKLRELTGYVIRDVSEIKIFN